MLASLASHDLTVTELAGPFDISLAAASKHIKVLERAGLIERRVQGRTHTCRLAPEALARAYRWLADYRHFWTDRLDALETAMRNDDTP